MPEQAQYSPFKAALVQSGPAADAVQQTGPAAIAAQGLAGPPPGGGAAAPFQPPPPLQGTPQMPVGPRGLMNVNPSGGGAPNSQPTNVPLAARMVPITAHSESRNRERDASGRLITSPAGAQGAMQVMPGTNMDPGFGVRPAADSSDAERTRVGRDYIAAMTQRYGGDPAKGWAAYNAGPGALDRRIKRYGDNWLAHMPAETQKYVATNMAMLGQGGAGATPVAGAQPTGSPVPAMQPEAVPEAPQAPTAAPEAPKVAAPNGSARLAMARRLMESGNPYLMSMAQNYLDSGLTERSENERQARAEQFGLNKEGYTAAMNDFTGARTDARQAGYQNNRDATNRNFQRETGNNQNAFATVNREDTQAFQAQQQELQNAFTHKENVEAQENALKVQERKNDAFKPPVAAQKDYMEGTNQIKSISNALSLLNKRPASVGIKFSVGDMASQRADPDGEPVRAAITNLAGLLLHGISGAAVTPEEFQRNRSWLPQVNDTPEAIRVKMENLRLQSQNKIDTIRGMYGSGGAFSYSPAAVNPAAPFNPAGGATDGWGDPVAH